jgi:endonuclease YncB( thermonuclease family)
MRKLIAVMALATSGAAHAQLVGVVVGVPDGDTLSVKVHEQVVNVDLKNVDAPEVGQPFGARARDSLAELCDAKTIALDELGIDRERRIFGEAECGGVDAAREQVKRGLAWAVPGTAKTPLRNLEREAKAANRGLWSEPAPVPPWQWSAIFTQ